MPRDRPTLRRPPAVPRRSPHRLLSAAPSLPGSRSRGGAESSRRRRGPLRRTSSEPILFPSARGDSLDGDHGRSILNAASLPRFRTCTDVCSPAAALLLSSPSPPGPAETIDEGGGAARYAEDAKVVVSVTVDGSAGPVRELVRLGATVAETIGIVLDRYGDERRSPALERRGGDGEFQLYHSYFCLQGLNKDDKLGDVGGRSFHLRRINGGRNDEIELTGRSGPPVVRIHLLMSFILRRLSKFGRRTRKIWKILGCMDCG